MSEKLTGFFKVIDFVQQHLNADVKELLLKQHHYPDIPIREAALQIQSRQKAQAKLPSWFFVSTICYPSILSLEQCSSEQTAQFKASLVRGNTLIDLTGGMGVDTAAFSHRFQDVIYIERNQELCKVTQHNFSQLAITNVQLVNADSGNWLNTYAEQADWIYLDPARRDEAGGKVVRLQDCEPDILILKKNLFQKAKNILLKASPMLDIELAIRELKDVSRVYIVAVDNEVKELLFHLVPVVDSEPEIIAVNLIKSQELVSSFSFYRKDENEAVVLFAAPEKFLYEPNAAILKSGAFRSVALAYNLSKIHPNSHLYTSEMAHTAFPGRIFKVLSVTKLDKKELQKFLPDGKANITVRNFPMTVAEIRKKTGIREGGDVYIFATTDFENRRIVLICEKLEMT